jgi:NAD(P)-dependent dehydrogenase (short-subunit alcohol dehydrogenase family)
LGRSAERGEERARAILDSGGEAFFQGADASIATACKPARDAILQQTGSIDILINAAGRQSSFGHAAAGQEFSELSMEGWQQVFDLN